MVAIKLMQTCTHWHDNSVNCLHEFNKKSLIAFSYNTRSLFNGMHHS